MWPMQQVQPWWPPHLGQPNSSGSQNNLHYAYFADARRLAINDDGFIYLYDTGDHWISGVSQQQSNNQRSIAFTSQYGNVDVSKLTLVEK